MNLASTHYYCRTNPLVTEANPETKAFAESYMQTVTDDCNDFDHLADASQESSRTLVGDDDDDIEEGNVNVEKFTRDDLIQQIYDQGLEDEVRPIVWPVVPVFL